MYSALNAKGKFAGILSAQCKWETDKSDTTGEAQFGEGIIEKAEGG